MLLMFTDALTNQSIAVNPYKIVAVFVAPEDTDVKGKTVLTLTSGTVFVNDDYLTVVGRINGELK